jgi:hypothetical protein
MKRLRPAVRINEHTALRRFPVKAGLLKRPDGRVTQQAVTLRKDWDFLARGWSSLGSQS